MHISSPNGLRLLLFGVLLSTVIDDDVDIIHFLADGGIGRSYISQLEALWIILNRVQDQSGSQNSVDEIRPSEYFDMMGGADSGGSVPTKRVVVAFG
jgi:hypothetical protein